MKKRFALLVGVMLILTAVFAACSQTVATEKYARWKEGETYAFNITLSDFSSDNTKLFNTYDRKVLQKGDDGKTKEVTLACYKDDIITATEAALMANYDQIRPVDASGSYTMSIESDTSNTCKLVTSQVIYSQYETKTLQDLQCLDKLSAYVVTGDENPFENTSDRTTLRSETTSTVVLSKNADQLPKSSVLENKGFYIGKTEQAVSEYKYETTYDFDNLKVTVKKNDGEAEERSLKLARGGSCIDAGQLLLYVRSLDKSSVAFQDSPSVSIYDVTTDSVTTATFALTRQFNALLNNNGSEVVANLNAVLVSVGGMPFMAQYNLPDISKVADDGSGHDYFISSGDRRCKFTTVKFRSGWYSYELAYDDGIQQALNAVKLERVS